MLVEAIQMLIEYIIYCKYWHSIVIVVITITINVFRKSRFAAQSSLQQTCNTKWDTIFQFGTLETNV